MGSDDENKTKQNKNIKGKKKRKQEMHHTLHAQASNTFSYRMTKLKKGYVFKKVLTNRKICTIYPYVPQLNTFSLKYSLPCVIPYEWG